MNEQRATLMMEGRIVPTIRPLRPREIVFLLANRPGIVFVGTPADLLSLETEGYAPHRIPWKQATALIRGGLEEAERLGDPNFLWDWEDLVPKDARKEKRAA